MNLPFVSRSEFERALADNKEMSSRLAEAAREIKQSQEKREKLQANVADLRESLATTRTLLESSDRQNLNFKLELDDLNAELNDLRKIAYAPVANGPVAVNPRPTISEFLSDVNKQAEQRQRDGKGSIHSELREAAVRGQKAAIVG